MLRSFHVLSMINDAMHQACIPLVLPAPSWLTMTASPVGCTCRRAALVACLPDNQRCYAQTLRATRALCSLLVHALTMTAPPRRLCLQTCCARSMSSLPRVACWPRWQRTRRPCRALRAPRYGGMMLQRLSLASDHQVIRAALPVGTTMGLLLEGVALGSSSLLHPGATLRYALHSPRLGDCKVAQLSCAPLTHT